MSYIVVDVESDGPLLGVNSMVCFGAVVIDKDGILDKTFYGQTSPISSKYDSESLAISGFTRDQHEEFQNPQTTMLQFREWIRQNNKGQAILISDNNGYDASWINWYFHKFTGDNPFGWSSRRIGDMFAGFMNDPYYKWKVHRKTKHTHHPVDDAKGNAEALIFLKNLGFNIKF
jgi:DNA polymerase III alpha subunit (gram-positive type)